MATIAFTDIVLAGLGSGTLRLSDDDGGTLDWSTKSGKSQKVSASSITSATWVHVGRNRALMHIVAKTAGKENGASAGNDEDDADGMKDYYCYQGFSLRDEETVKDYLQSTASIVLGAETVDASGLNAGNMGVDPDRKCIALTAKVHNDDADDDDDGEVTPILEVPLRNLTQCAAPSKNVVELQFATEEEPQEDDETLVQMTFLVPGTEEGAALDWQETIMEAAGLREEKAIRSAISPKSWERFSPLADGTRYPCTATTFACRGRRTTTRSTTSQSRRCFCWTTRGRRKCFW